MKLRCSIFKLAALPLFCAAVSTTTSTHAAAPTALQDKDRIVVMISVDGLANFYIDDPSAEIPTIRKLAAEGAKASSMKASDPTVTWPNHTTLVTGVSPGVHGVVGNNYFDRVKGEKVTLIWDPTLEKDQIIKVPTVYDVAKAAGLKTAAIRWPCTRGAHAVDWNSPDLGEDSLILKYTTPALLDECKEAGYKLTQREDGTGKIGTFTLKESIDDDTKWMNIFDMVLRKHHPNLALLHIVEVDHTEHADGPRSPEAYEAIKAADGQVKQVVDELEKDYPGKATVFIVSDHGFSANKISVLPNVVLKKAGLVQAEGRKVTGGSVEVVPQGGSAFVYIMDDANRDDIIKKVKAAFANVEGVSSVIGSDQFAEYGIADPKRDPHEPDMMLFAKMGYFFGDTAAGSIPVDTKPERKGSHGHDSHFPDLHAMCVAWGDGIKPGVNLGDIDNRSVAPTIAKLLGIEIPNVEGKPLTEALQ
ncbi:MAG TPA: ectonucleotide pyrophosphatase/phosphodiesterase [Lacipirellulaceae bacterium]|jgi:predicted AlkP superfamily pyrophosphatase or phosphodiesterase|nr:ectonucleotide pyrophosphatase/phosphodiesterase [Lacipirellulaceae bacterium]